MTGYIKRLIDPAGHANGNLHALYIGICEVIHESFIGLRTAKDSPKTLAGRAHGTAETRLQGTNQKETQ